MDLLSVETNALHEEIMKMIFTHGILLSERQENYKGYISYSPLEILETPNLSTAQLRRRASISNGIL